MFREMGNFNSLWGQRLQEWAYQDVSGHEIPRTFDGMNTLDVET